MELLEGSDSDKKDPTFSNYRFGVGGVLSNTDTFSGSRQISLDRQDLAPQSELAATEPKPSLGRGTKSSLLHTGLKRSETSACTIASC